jgi:LL-diaminopimelate aminotransferase
MICPANRLSSVTEYYFSTKLKQIDKLRESGVHVLNLGIGNPDLPPSEEVLEVLKQKVDGKNNHGYQSYIGHRDLRLALANWYKRYFKVEMDCDKEIYPLMGSKEGIMYISLAFLNPGDGVLIANPSYPAYRAVANLVEAKIIDYNLNEENGWFPDFEEIEKNDLSKVKIMWVNYPNMPTGTNIGLDGFKKIVDFGKKHDILICNDNPYSFILNTNYVSILQVPGAKEIAIEMNSLSKSHNMAGWRIGALFSNQEFVSHILRVKSNVDNGMFLPLQLAAAKALECTDEWYEFVNLHYKKRRLMAEDIMNKLACVFSTEQSGMFLWAKIPSMYKDSFEFADLLLEKYGVFITPGGIFGSNGNRYLRISLASSDESLLDAKDRIKHHIN